MAGKFEIFTDKAGKYRFRLKAGNGEIILSSQGYASKRGCRTGIQSVQRNATDPDCFDKQISDSGKYSFCLCAKNGQVIGRSQTYKSDSGRDNGIASVGRSAPGAELDDQTKRRAAVGA